MAKRGYARKVSSLWLCHTITKLARGMYPDDARARRFRPTVRWASRWTKNHNVSKRRRSNSKNNNEAERSHKFRPFHRGLHILMNNRYPPRQVRGGLRYRLQEVEGFPAEKTGVRARRASPR